MTRGPQPWLVSSAPAFSLSLAGTSLFSGLFLWVLFPAGQQTHQSLVSEPLTVPCPEVSVL